MKNYLKKMLSKPVNFDMRVIVGCGGESVVLKDKDDSSKAVKIVKTKPNYELEELEIEGIRIKHERDAYDKDQPNEMIANELQHPNIIKYDQTQFQYIDDKLFHVTSKLKTKFLKTG